jgi:hypothetical protein
MTKFLRTAAGGAINSRFVREIVQRRNHYDTWDTIAELDDGARVALMPTEIGGASPTPTVPATPKSTSPSTSIRRERLENPRRSGRPSGRDALQ